jgi:hypothetical protein
MIGISHRTNKTRKSSKKKPHGSQQKVSTDLSRLRSSLSLALPTAPNRKSQPLALALLSLSCSLLLSRKRKAQLTGLTRRSGRQKSPRRVHESGQCVGREHGVREEAKHLNTSVNPAVMQARAEEENFSTRVALGVRLGSEAVEPQRRLLDRSTCESWSCKKQKPP